MSTIDTRVLEMRRQLAATLEGIRRARNLTFEDAPHAFGVTRSRFGSYVRVGSTGWRDMPLSVLFRMCIAANVQPASLMPSLDGAEEALTPRQLAAANRMAAGTVRRVLGDATDALEREAEKLDTGCAAVVDVTGPRFVQVLEDAIAAIRSGQLDHLHGPLLNANLAVLCDALAESDRTSGYVKPGALSLAHAILEEASNRTENAQ